MSTLLIERKKKISSKSNAFNTEKKNIIATSILKKRNMSQNTSVDLNNLYASNCN